MRPIVLAFIAILTLDSFKEREEWTNLLDKDLTHWENYLSYKHKVGYNGNVPVDESGMALEPIGYNKDKGQVFSVIEDKGELVLKISGEIYGCVFTKKEYENYHVKLKVRWGNQKYDPRKNKLKDSGILYHSIGEAGAEYWRTWMLSQEFQIMEGHMGDYWQQSTSAADIRAYLPEGKMNSIASTKQPFLSFGSGTTEGYCMRSENHESPDNSWTTLELICFEDKSLHIVNGHVVMVLKNSHYKKDAKEIPLTKGRIQLQSEAAEVFFKDIRIRSIEALPEAYVSLFK
ncbi:3-keto-disaccharide hydrolase [Chryseosolibacter indicus]|uniref:DUF1080 domain-containing protein n=1 Tax=Chryseosolibacter indicus TaxID=2782351 RepID=A0ABS5VPF9_9BACT|nr:DUF1080 domain-containing protein [Chryseosolibacter indicus]MBT1703322.1 DUF1080 domain-containing protein [Chryseosolibacter indicus]